MFQDKMQHTPTSIDRRFIESYENSPAHGLRAVHALRAGLLLGALIAILTEPLMRTLLGANTAWQYAMFIVMPAIVAYGMMYPDFYGRNKLVNRRMKITFFGFRNSITSTRLWLQVPSYRNSRGDDVPVTYSRKWLALAPVSFIVGITAMLPVIFIAAIVIILIKGLWSGITGMDGQGNVFSSIISHISTDFGSDLAWVAGGVFSLNALVILITSAVLFWIGYAFAYRRYYRTHEEGTLGEYAQAILAWAGFIAYVVLIRITEPEPVISLVTKLFS